MVNSLYNSKMCNDNECQLLRSILTQLAKILAGLRSFHFKDIGNFQFIPDFLGIEMRGIIDLPGNSLKDPSSNFCEYAKTYLNYYLSEMEALIKKNSSDKEIYEKYLPLLKEVVASSPFFSLENSDEDFVLTHQDFVMKNILIKDNEVTGVLDWEWFGSAPFEMEALSGIDFIQSEEDKAFFKTELEKNHIFNFFNSVSPHRKKIYKLICAVYSLVAYREWFEGKLLHTARLLDQKLYQRKIRSQKSITPKDVLEDVVKTLDRLIIDFMQKEEPELCSYP
jgi:hypothetical protein